MSLSKFTPASFVYADSAIAVACNGTSEEQLGQSLTGLINAFEMWEANVSSDADGELALLFVPSERISAAERGDDVEDDQIEFWGEVAKYPSLYPLVDVFFGQCLEVWRVGSLLEDCENFFPQTACFTLGMHHAHYLGWYARFSEHWDLTHECEQGWQMSQMIEKHGWCEETMNMICVRSGIGVGLFGFHHMQEFSLLIVKHCPAPLDQHPFFIRLVEAMMTAPDTSVLDCMKEHMTDEIIAATRKVLTQERHDTSELEQW